MWERFIHSERGFTVTEMLITLLVLTIAFLGFTTLFVNIESVADQAKDIIVANDIAYTKVQQYENTDFTDITVGDIEEEIEIEDFASSLPAALKAPKTAKVYATALTPTLKQIRVTVTYNNDRNGEEISFVDYIQQSGVGR